MSVFFFYILTLYSQLTNSYNNIRELMRTKFGFSSRHRIKEIPIDNDLEDTNLDEDKLPEFRAFIAMIREGKRLEAEEAEKAEEEEEEEEDER